MKTIKTVSLLALMCLTAMRVDAAMTFEFTSSLLYAQPGQTVTFSGSLSNTGPTIFLTGWSYTFPLPVDDSPFLTAPFSLGDRESFTGPILSVNVPSGALQGLYTGTFNILGGAAPGSSDLVGSDEFGVTVIPEPSTSLGTLGALVLVLAMRR